MAQHGASVAGRGSREQATGTRVPWTPKLTCAEADTVRVYRHGGFGAERLG